MVAVTFTWATSECTMYPDGAALGDSNFDPTSTTYVLESQICKSSEWASNMGGRVVVVVCGGGGGQWWWCVVVVVVCGGGGVWWWWWCVVVVMCGNSGVW